ncbi:MAG: twin-arginine translocation signal domain-containing protein [Acidimicrobiales bacterium]
MSLEVSRRQFLKGSLAGGAGAAGVAGLTAFGFDGEAAAQEVRELKIARATETRTVCPYCAVGCSMIAYTLGDTSLNTVPTLVHIEGDPDSPINGGTLCPKGASTVQLAINGKRAEHPLYRAPGAAEWSRISWDEALDRLARWMKDSRDSHFAETDDEGRTVNRQTGFAFMGGATISNEEGFLTAKLMRALGTVYLEQQARV